VKYGGHDGEVSRSRKANGFALCLTYHLPNVSGLTLSAHELARHIKSLGFPVKVFAGRVPADAPRHETVDGLEVVRSRSIFSLGKALVMPTYPIDLWRSLDEIGVVNVHLPCLDAAAVAIVAKLRGRKLIVSYICSMSKASLADRLLRAAAAIPHLIAGACADVIQVVSTDYAARSTFCRIFRSKVRHAPLPIALKLFPDEVCPPRKGEPRPSKQIYRIGYVGRIAKQKTLELLFEAIPFLKGELDAPFVIDLVGPTTDVIGETYWRDILAAAEASGGTVRYGGTLTGRPLADFYSSLDVLVLPSTDRLESFGLVQVEAMLRRVPVVASDLPGMRVPIARTDMGKLFNSGDPKALAAALVEVLTNGPERELDASSLEDLFGNEVACAPYVEMLRQQ
jgi:glycosyltransferase involved in cell wall biosynthesis